MHGECYLPLLHLLLTPLTTPRKDIERQLFVSGNSRLRVAIFHLVFRVIIVHYVPHCIKDNFGPESREESVFAP